MKNAVHPNFKKAAWINAIRIVVNILITIIILPKGENLGMPILMRLSMISILVEIIITLLISLGYEWMKWVMLVFTIMSILSVINLPALLDNAIITIAKHIFSVTVDIIIIILLFKATERKSSIADGL